MNDSKYRSYVRRRKMNYLIAVDLEGIHGVVGEGYKTLTDSFDYNDAIEGATLEINTAIRALFDCGAEKVAVWDNHKGGGNLDFSLIDHRATEIRCKSDPLRFDFTKEHNFKGVIFLGYHAREGKANGVLAHTYSSKTIQYIKLNGKAVGEIFVDSHICAMLGVEPIFLASDDVGVNDMEEVCPTVKTVITKYGKGRNKAEFRKREDVLEDIYNGVCEAVLRTERNVIPKFPEKPSVEIRYTRAERAAKKYNAIKESAYVPVEYGEDTHILHFEVTSPQQIFKLI